MYKITRTPKQWGCEMGGDLEDVTVSGPRGEVEFGCYRDRGFLAMLPVQTPDGRCIFQSYSGSFRRYTGMSRKELLDVYEIVATAAENLKQGTPTPT